MDLSIAVIVVIFALGAVAGYLASVTRLRSQNHGAGEPQPVKPNTQAFSASQEELRLIFELSPIGLSITNREGRYLRVNKAFCDAIGYSEQELLGLRFQDITHPDDLPHNLDLLRDLLDRKIDHCEFEKRYIGKDSRVLDVLLQVSAMPDAGSQSLHFIGQIVDITERKRTQQKLLQHYEVLRTLNETTLALMNRLDLADLLEAILSRAGTLLNTPNGCVYLADPGGRLLRASVTVGVFKQHFWDEVRYGEGLSGRVWQSAQTLAVIDYAHWSNRLTRPGMDSLRAVVGVPLKSGDQVVGVLCLCRLEEGRIFDSDELTLLTRFAELASIALDNARLYTSAQQELAERTRAEEKLRQQNDYLTALNETTLALMNRLDLADLLEAILSRAASLMGTPDGYVYLAELDGGHMLMRVGIGHYRGHIGYQIAKTTGLSGRVWLSGIPLVVNDYATWPDRHIDRDWDMPTAVVGLPLQAGNQTVGVLGLSHFEAGRTFTNDEMALLSRFAELASIALDNARLYTSAQQELAERTRAEEKLRRQNDYLTALNQTTLALINRLDLTDLLKTIITSAGTLIGSSEGFFYLAETPDDEEMVLVVGTGYHVRDIGYRMKRGEGFAGQVWATDQPMTINDYSTWPGRLLDPALDPLRALVGMPLRSGNKVIGVLGLSRMEDGRTFAEEEIASLNHFAELASIALDNARLYTSAQRELAERKRVEEQLRRQNEYLAALNETTLDLMNRLDLTGLLEAILVRAAALLGTSHGCIYLIEPDGATAALKISRGFFDQYAGYRVALDDPAGMTSKVFRTGQPMAINDYANWPDRAAVPGAEQIRAAVTVPLKSGAHAVGVLSLCQFEAGCPFGEDEVALLSRFAELASIALDNARLYVSAQQELAERTRAEDELRRLNADLEAHVRARTAELHHEHALLQAILDGMGEGVVYSRLSQIQYVNRAFSHLIGFRAEEVIGQPLTLLRGAVITDRAIELFSTELWTGKAWRGEVQVRRKSGTEFNAALVITRIVEPDSEAPGLIMIVRDITEEKQLQAQKARFIANASHELRTPLTSLKTRIYLLRKQPDLVADHSRALEQVTDRMISLVEDLLDVTRFERGVISLQRQSVVIQTVITDVVQWQQPEADRKHVSLIADLPDRPIHVSADPTRLMQVIMNLTVNAINYTANGGHVAVQLHIEQVERCAYAVIRVRDTGSGIAPEHLQRIFEPFFRANEGSTRGTGLGLSIAKEIVDLHGGLLTVDSEVGKGSAFSVWLPLHDVTPSENE